MSEEEKPTVEGIIEYFKEKDVNIWDINNFFDDQDSDYQLLKQVFSPQQLELLGILLHKGIDGLEFHNSKDSEAHQDIREKIEDLAAKFRNHRHETGKTYSAKPEY